MFGLSPLGVFECLIETTILSHHVDNFTVVVAFFHFAISCPNILLGLAFAVKAKWNCLIRTWRSSPGVFSESQARGMLEC